MKFFRSARLSEFSRGISDDRGDPASFAIGVGKCGAINAIVALPSDREAGIGLVQMNWFRIPIPGQAGGKFIGEVE